MVMCPSQNWDLIYMDNRDTAIESGYVMWILPPN